MKQLLRSQWTQTRRWLQGKPVRLQPLLCATLDRDDVALARAWRAQPGQWQSRAPVDEFTRQFCHWLGVRRGWAFMGGRAALYAIVQALELKAGDEVVLPAFTCQCVLNACTYQGVRVRWADIENQSFGMDADALSKVLGPATKAIMIQHSFGLINRDFERLLQLARERGLWVIEDCAHATGAEWRGRKLGTFGDIALFSSERSKIINTIHGGIVVAQHDTLARRMDAIHARAAVPSDAEIARLLNTVEYGWYVHKHRWRPFTAAWAEWRFGAQVLAQMQPEEFEGRFVPRYAQRMVAPVAALGLNQLAKMAHYQEKRRAGAAHWDAWCDKQGLRRPLVLPDSQPAYLRYPVLVEPQQRADLRWVADRLGMTAGVWFSSVTHPVARDSVGCPVGEDAVRRVLNLPTIFVEAVRASP
ncbi:DegT/DnrJ/EryC1/StrS aminotransferase family protein [Verminephrobacter aporrectodeae subsp. tuberculatae]|uniref:DegT/DnrJ/EryC1/StrS aminotransferase family protein n=1 Tax=Verminephrobacter aporrectodeae subsp. tuberculatae TaxID=1110392 RepID=A0ABT3KYF6_9BURK|nr:aminotransferase class I/II-fold pyridoxal phosphate-dependent enzyme [Verminephrobacter aporrectodeae]MCW5223551.1 DegT/DnrJ/EryC1/StrS aminotransferase family protein [Verminephrobacter aporrectodeae subsp. tuberculatae]MCW5289017.1 DegT/DnrJ/EryC1/StrS aminotransferase family protein [Verminephrobacter aporrectodeae subsp. tuberculatae]MCW5323352.1 DegT/DnrJ/EryC1/StrS aminotransferase family protein [Verminephrobacter aporrectodeae subsp. tuberculatae]